MVIDSRIALRQTKKEEGDLLEEIKAIFSDGDGVLLDSLSHGLVYYPKVAEALGFRTPTTEEMIKFWGWKWRDFLHALWPKVNIDKLEKDFDDAYHGLGFDKIFVPQIEGANETLLALRKTGYFLALITNRRRHSVERRFREAGIELKHFHLIQAVDDCHFYKPDPRVFDRVLEEAQKRGISKQEILYMGDTVASDWEAAKGASLGFVGVLTGPTTREEFLVAGVQTSNILESIGDLPVFLRERRKKCA